MLSGKGIPGKLTFKQYENKQMKVAGVKVDEQK